MQTHTMTTITLFAVTLSACSLDWGDPCDNPANVLYVEELCEAGETGEVEPPDQLPCEFEWDDGEGSIDQNPLWCRDSTWMWPSPKMGDHNWHSRDLSECGSLAGPFPCNRSWTDPWYGQDECYLCEAMLSEVPGLQHPPYTGTTWPMCEIISALDTYHRYIPATRTLDDLLDSPVPNWQAHISCGSNHLMVPAGTCEPVMLSPSPKYAPDSAEMGVAEWTCRCDSDADCQTGAVCEAGFVVADGELVPRPTLCTWDDGSGTPNGAAPDGPTVYGLESWGDGVTIDGYRVTFTADMARALRQGLLNDDLRLGSDGELARVGPTSLAAHLGIVEGDRVEVSQRTLDAFLLGETVDVPVTHIDGTATHYTLRSDLDG